MHRKILIMGLPGAGKTTLANALVPLLSAAVFNADAVHGRDVGYAIERIVLDEETEAISGTKLRALTTSPQFGSYYQGNDR